MPLVRETSLPELTGEMLADVVRRKGATAGIEAWYDEMARILTNVEEIGVWPDGLLDAEMSMIPKADGDATPLGQ